MAPPPGLFGPNQQPSLPSFLSPFPFGSTDNTADPVVTRNPFVMNKGRAGIVGGGGGGGNNLPNSGSSSPYLFSETNGM